MVILELSAAFELFRDIPMKTRIPVQKNKNNKTKVFFIEPPDGHTGEITIPILLN
jgi:hypothetical protein